MDLSADKGRMDAYLQPAGSTKLKPARAEGFDLGAIDVTAQLAIEEEIRCLQLLQQPLHRLLHQLLNQLVLMSCRLYVCRLLESGSEVESVGRKAREPATTQSAAVPSDEVRQLQSVLGSDVSVQHCEALLSAASGNAATAASMHFDGFTPSNQTKAVVPRVTVPEGAHSGLWVRA